MKKIATITFHAAYNYGSNLQAYALQEYVKKISQEKQILIEYRIINFRTDFQKDFYSLFKKNNSLKNVFKNLMVLRYYKEYKIKCNKHEEFIRNKLNLTDREYNSFEELKDENFDFDYYISGSDQIWNVRAQDFDWAYFLGFINEGIKLSYSASFGPLDINFRSDIFNKCRGYLKDYRYISTREKGSNDNIEKILGCKTDILVDPTILLSKREWQSLIKDIPSKNYEYIFFYELEPSKETLRLLKKLSNLIGLPIVISKYNNKYDYFNNFIKCYDTGPLEFLKLINDAKLVISTSFHGTVFSILFEKPFYTIDGNKDNRINNLLKMCKLDDRVINDHNYMKLCEKYLDINFSFSNNQLEKEREKSTLYLIKALDLEKRKE